MAHTIVTAESSVKPKAAADRRKAGDFQRVESGIRKIEVRCLGTANMSVFIDIHAGTGVAPSPCRASRCGRYGYQLDRSSAAGRRPARPMTSRDPGYGRRLPSGARQVAAQGNHRTSHRLGGQQPGPLRPRRCRTIWLPQPASLSARMAAANATPVKRTKAIASTVMPTASPTPIVAYRSTSMCHVIGFAKATIRNMRGSGSRG